MAGRKGWWNRLWSGHPRTIHKVALKSWTTKRTSALTMNRKKSIRSCLAIQRNDHLSSQLQNCIISTTIDTNIMDISPPNSGLPQNLRADTRISATAARDNSNSYSRNKQNSRRVALTCEIHFHLTNLTWVHVIGRT